MLEYQCPTLHSPVCGFTMWQTVLLPLLLPAFSTQVSAVMGDRKQAFTITQTWDGQSLNHSDIHISLVGEEGALKVKISAPYFGDPAPEGGKPGEAFFKLWDYEVVEAFFLNSQDQYLELEFGPHGQHLSLLLNGRRNAIKHSLPLDYRATIDPLTGTWTGVATIPASYFPPNISLFNAYAIHGTGENRVYEALYESSGRQPDFHRLEKFQPIDFSSLIPENIHSNMSSLWLVSIEEAEVGQQTEKNSLSFNIEKTWDNKPIDHQAVTVKLSGADGNLVVEIKAPYFGDPAPEGGKPGEAFFKLWDYEVVEAFFLNSQNQYLELEFGPHGQHLSLLLNGRRNAIKHSLPLDYRATIDPLTGTWTGVATIPASYFPPNISLFNAYAIHGTGENRVYEALYESSGPQPDFHRLEKFQPLDFSSLIPENMSSNISALWENSIAEAKLGQES